MGCCLTKQDDKDNIVCYNCNHIIKNNVEFYAYMGTIYFFCSKECYNKYHYKIIYNKNYSIYD